MNTTAALLPLLVGLHCAQVASAQLAVPPEPSGSPPVKIDLNGTWKFQTAQVKPLSGIPAVDESWQAIRVPGEWSMQGFTVEPGQPATYYRTVEIPEGWKGRTVYLRCDGVFSSADIAINGLPAEGHAGPLVAFEKEITSLLRFGETNHLVIGVTAETQEDTFMSGTQYAAHQLGGILRKIYLYAVPPVHLADLTVTTRFDQHYDNAVLTVSGVLKNPTRVAQAAIQATLIGPDEQAVRLVSGGQSIAFEGSQQKPIHLSFPVLSPQKWDAEHPRLYRLALEITSEAGREVIERQIGFRQIEVLGNQLLVNGVPVKLKGVNRHEVHPLLGRSLSPEWWQKDAELFKRANVNYIRTSHYPPAEEFIEWCDQIGLYVELENPLCWVGHHANPYWETHEANDPQLYAYFERVSAANLAFFRNHPSIVMWSMANESMWTENWSKLADFYAKADPTRPATFHDQAYGGFNNYGSTKLPVANIHYPGPGGPALAEDFPRPLLFGEYAHLNTYNRQEIVTDPGVRDAWGRGLQAMWEGMYRSRGCLGGAIWSGIDDVFLLPDGRAVGYGEWGPIDGWRREKPEYFHIKKCYSPVKIHDRQVAVPQPGDPVRLEVENRFDFTNLSECEIAWRLEDEAGTVQVDLPPRQSTILAIQPEMQELDGKLLTVQFISPQGIEVETCVVEIGKVKRDILPLATPSSEPLLVQESQGSLQITGTGFDWTLDLTSGYVSGRVRGRAVLSRGAELMMLNLTTGPCTTEHSLQIPFHNSLCANRQVKPVIWDAKNEMVTADVQVSYDEAEGAIHYRFAGDGTLTVEYGLISRVEMDPRQWGMIFTTPRNVDRLQWSRNSLWSGYPENHIGRAAGLAVPFGPDNLPGEAHRRAPAQNWRDDANTLGSNDFRATRENIYWAALTGGDGTGIAVRSNGRQAFRAFVEGNSGIRFLVADFSTGGGDLFFSTHYGQERRKLQAGSPVNGSVTLQLVAGAE